MEERRGAVQAQALLDVRHLQGSDFNVYYYIGERLKLEWKTENILGFPLT